MLLNNTFIFQGKFPIVEPLICPYILMWSFSYQFLAYFCFQSLAQGIFDSLIHLHQSLAPETLLMVSGSWSPKTPWLLGLQILSQATKTHFFFSSPLTHKKSLYMLLVCCIIPLGAGRVENMNMGMACETTHVSTRHPSKFKDLHVHFLILSSSLFIIGSHTSLLRGLSMRGMPKYLEGSWSLWNPRILVIFL